MPLNLFQEPDCSDLRKTQFTQRASRKVEMISEISIDMTEEEIYEAVVQLMELIPFSLMLKRYLHRTREIEGDVEEIELSKWTEVINSCFERYGAPTTVPDSSTPWKTRVRNWLTQDNSSRDSVFMLGFGLRMPVAHVSEFLTKYLLEEDFQINNSRECIYQYCFAHDLPYANAYQLMNDPLDDVKPVYSACLSGNEELLELRRHLAYLKTSNVELDSENAARNVCLELFAQCQNNVAKIYTVSEYMGRTDWKAEEISAVDIERILYAIPYDSNGNLARIDNSRLSKIIRGNYRLRRQRLTEILKGKLKANRFDIITLAFLLFDPEGRTDGLADDPETRAKEYEAFTNQLLKKCGMSPLYLTNPYEAIIMIALKSVYPLGLFNDIWSVVDQEQNEE